MPELVGKVELKPLSIVKPNGWNPNEMDAQERASMKYGLENDGWLASQSLLIWGSDEKGKKQNLIIDGEHRWKVATELGFEKGPMVFLNGIEEAQAKRLTIALGARRGRFNSSIGDVVRSIQTALPNLDLSLSLGFEPEELYKHLRFDAETVSRELTETAKPPSVAPTTRSENQSVIMVPLFFTHEQHGAFVVSMQNFGREFQTDTISETVLEALRRAHRRSAS